MRRPLVRRYGRRMAVATGTFIVAAAGIARAPVAAADWAAELSNSVVTARSNSSCGPLRLDPTVQQAAIFAVRSSDNYISHNARSIPVSDPLPILKDYGSTATKAKLLQGAGKTPADAIKFILISGYNVIPDCAYTSYGGATARNKSDGYFLTAVVLAAA